VRDNIAAFGGDPGNVMTFRPVGRRRQGRDPDGHAAAAGLYHKVATMSGQHVTAMGPIHAAVRAKRLHGKAGPQARPGRRAENHAAGQLVEALKMRDPMERKGGVIFWSVMDHGVLPRHPFYPDAPRESGHIPMIIGNTHDETKAFLGGDPKNFALTWEELPGRMEP
jgi:para-nitrobenzyl esterase